MGLGKKEKRILISPKIVKNSFIKSRSISGFLRYYTAVTIKNKLCLTFRSILYSRLIRIIPTTEEGKT